MDNAKNVLTGHLDILQNNSSFDFHHNWNLTNPKRQKGIKKVTAVMDISQMPVVEKRGRGRRASRGPDPSHSTSLKKERRVRKLDLVKVEEEFGGSKGTEGVKQSSTGGSHMRKEESSRGMERKDRLSLIREDSTSLREKDDFEKQVHVVQTLLQN